MPPITANLGIRIGPTGPFVFGSRSDRWRPSQRHDTPKGFEAISRRLSAATPTDRVFPSPEGRASKLVWLARPSGWVSESGLIPGVFAALKPPANCSDTFGVVNPKRETWVTEVANLANEPCEFSFSPLLRASTFEFSKFQIAIRRFN